MTNEESFMNRLADEIERLSPSDYAHTLFRDRPYDGQPHTATGVRGKQEVKGITFRDIRDCFIRGCFRASGLPVEEWPKSLYELPWDEMDPLAVCQNMLCEIEKLMGIFPNVPLLESAWDHAPILGMPTDEEARP